MDRDLLERWLTQGLSLAEIGVLTNRHPTTVSHWCRKHGLEPNGRGKHPPKGKPDRAVLEALVQKGLTLEEIGGRLQRSAQTVRYWIDKYRLPRPIDHRRGKRGLRRDDPGSRGDGVCPRHGQGEFVRRPDGYWRCRRCRVEAVMKRRRKVKQMLVEEAGGRCVRCGFDEHPSALQFHHLDPATKKFAVSRKGVTRSIAEARAEAKKCVLLCASCHAMVEAGVVTLA